MLVFYLIWQINLLFCEQQTSMNTAQKHQMKKQIICRNGWLEKLQKIMGENGLDSTYDSKFSIDYLFNIITVKIPFCTYIRWKKLINIIPNQEPKCLSWGLVYAFVILQSNQATILNEMNFSGRNVCEDRGMDSVNVPLTIICTMSFCEPLSGRLTFPMKNRMVKLFLWMTMICFLLATSLENHMGIFKSV